MAEASARERKRLREGAATASEEQVEAAWRRLCDSVARHRDPYKYLSIAQALKLPDQKVCLFAVVYNIGAAVHSHGSDFTVTLRIVDESREAGISVTFFAKDTALLPCVKSSRDVISLHHVVVKQYGEDLFLAFNKRFSSFALYERKVSAECSPYQTSMRYRASNRDKELLTKMRTWLPNNPLGLKDLELHLSGLKSDSTFDLVCKVLHVCKDSGKWIFYVWDGTDTPAAELQAISDAKTVGSPPLLQGPPLPRNVLCKMPRVGTVLRIFLDSCVKEVIHKQKTPYWARFWKITCKQEFGIWKGVFLASSGVRLLSDVDGDVVDRMKMYNRRKANGDHRRPMASLPSNVVDVDHKDPCYSTLMESLTYHNVTHKLQTLVRVVAADPCRDSIRLTLEDPTTRIHAYVYENEMVKFFGGFPTEELMIKKMKKIMGMPEPEDNEEVAPSTINPPWIWCCLKSYYRDENDIWGSRRYQIYDTTIRG